MSTQETSTGFRRNPRQDWIARNRLHPLHGQGTVFPCVERGPTGLVRKNLHSIGFIGPGGLKRIDRSSVGSFVANAGRRVRPEEAVLEQLPLVKIENPDFYIMAVLDLVGGRLTEHDKDVLGQAHKLINAHSDKGAVLAVVFGESKEEAFDKAGVDRLIHFDQPNYQSYCPELQVAALQKVMSQWQARYCLFPDSIYGGRDLGSRLAAKLGEPVATQAWQVDKDLAISRGCGGREDLSRKTPRFILLAEECAHPIDETRHEVLPLTLESQVVTDPRIEDAGMLAVDPSKIPLGEAEFILSAGNGIHDWQQFHEAAAVLGATEGASRVAVDDGFMPRATQVGATGTWVTARVYVALGISGAVQHMQGIGQCEKVIAINTDAGCDMVKRADLSVIGDSQEILHELVELVKEHRRGESADVQ